MMSEENILPALGAYLEASKTEPTVWGKSDCTAWPQGWVEAVHGKPMSLPNWSSREEAYVLIEQAGSLAALWSEQLSEYGLHERWGDPRPGDVGVIAAHFVPQAGGIFLNHGLFALRMEPNGYRMIMPKPKTIIKTWAIL